MVTPNKQETEYIDVKRFKNHIITLGSEGCLINGKTKINSLKVKAVDTTGAGDTFNGVLAACIGDNMSLEKAAEYVTVASGIGVTRENVINAIPYKDEILGNVK